MARHRAQHFSYIISAHHAVTVTPADTYTTGAKRLSAPPSLKSPTESMVSSGVPPLTKSPANSICRDNEGQEHSTAPGAPNSGCSAELGLTCSCRRQGQGQVFVGGNDLGRRREGAGYMGSSMNRGRKQAAWSVMEDEAEKIPPGLEKSRWGARQVQGPFRPLEDYTRPRKQTETFT